MRFNPALSQWKNAQGLDLGSPAAYHWMMADTISVDLPKTFGQAPGPGCTVRIDVVDGLLLHELGHRHDRWIYRLLLGYGFTALLTAAFACLALTQTGWTPFTAAYVILFVAALLAGVVWRLGEPRIARWLERRADDYVLDRGGRAVCDALMDGLDTLEATGGSPGLSPVHGSAADRRRRQASRTSAGHA